MEPLAGPATMVDAHDMGADPRMVDPALPARYLDGLTLSWTDAATYAVAPGVARSLNNMRNIKLTDAISKTTGPWAPGSGAGSLDTGAVGGNTWYYVYLISDLSGNLDVLLSTNGAGAPTLPAGYFVSRRIGAFRTDGGGNIQKFFQRGDVFYLDVLSQVGVTPDTTRTQYNGSTRMAPQMPWLISLAAGKTTGSQRVILTLMTLQTDTAPSATLFTSGMVGAGIPAVSQQIHLPNNGNGGIRGTAAATTAQTLAWGWIDRRGKGGGVGTLPVASFPY